MITYTIHTFRAAVIFPPLFRDAAVVDVIIIVTFFAAALQILLRF